VKVHKYSIKSSGTAIYERSAVTVTELQDGWGKTNHAVTWKKSIVAEKLQ
jgi:hypothetical protein